MSAETPPADTWNTTDLAPLVPVLRDARVLCVGDLMLDRFVHGRVDRISPEAPIPVLRMESEHAMLGGAGNVVRNVLALGAGAIFVSVVGDDEAGRELTALVGTETALEPHLLRENRRQTTIKTRFVAGGQQLLRVDRETVTPVEPAIEAGLLEIARASLADVQALVLSDYAKGVLTDRCIEELIAEARTVGLPVLVDPKGRDFRRYRGATLLTPNRRELEEATGMPTGTDAEVEAAAARCIADCDLDALLVTRSERGMSLALRGEDAPTVHHLAAEAREVYDVSGAGDTVIAVAAASLAVGLAPTDAARLANIAAGIVVGKVGTAAVRPQEIIEVIRRRSDAGETGKVVGLETALERIEQWRRQDQRIGFTNGVFDLLHPGHVSLLGQAREACDRLVVAINTDDSVRRLKGPERPVQSESARALVLAAMATVDMVLSFDADTPIDLIQRIRPDVLVKGADYKVDQVVGADVVHSYGGRVILADLTEGQSTTRMVERMGNRSAPDRKAG